MSEKRTRFTTIIFSALSYGGGFALGTLLIIILFNNPSQNFHYSAWESPSLTENNIATEDRNAIGDFVDEFEYQWQKGIPIEEGVTDMET